MESPAVDDVFQLAGTTLEGRFVVDRAVAEGGFGVVYRGEQTTLERPVALKVLKTPQRYDQAAKEQFLAGFAAEAKTIARIRHPNIVHVYDFGVSVMPSGERAAWMALEWLTGVTLDEELSQRRGKGGRTPAECLALLRPALAALGVVHAAGVAHRDLKPANIMLVHEASGVAPKLLDFGIAKIMDADETPGTGQTQTRSGQIAFSPGYASPEQISQGRSGPWTDVHAMALILTEMLTDQRPLEGNESALIFQQIVDRVRPTPAKFGVYVGAWEAMLNKALAVSPSERFRDATELLRALESSLAEATATHGSTPPPVGSGPPGAPTDPFALMVTQRASVAALSDVPSPAQSNLTTSTPTSQGSGSVAPPAPKRSRSSAYLAGGGLAVALLGVGAYVTAGATRGETAAGGAPGLVSPTQAVTPLPSAAANPSTSASAASPSPPSPSAPAPAVASAPTPSVVDAASQTPPSRGSRPAAAEATAPARPKTQKRITIE